MSPEIKCGDFILKCDLEISENAQRKAVQELRETPENVRNAVEELKKLLETETDLNIPRTNEKWLIQFLRPCKFYPESARDLIRRNYNLRLKYSEITDILLPSKLRHVFEANLVSILPKRDQHGRRIVVTLLGKWDHNAITQDELYASSCLCTDFIQLEPESQINGIVYILDTEGLSFAQALKITPYKAKRVLDYIQENIPLRVKATHIVNQPKIFLPIFATIKPFFSDKFAKRVLMHGSNYKSLHQYISPDCLPECYGGTLKSEWMFGPETYQLLSHYEQQFQCLQGYGLKKKKK